MFYFSECFDQYAEFIKVFIEGMGYVDYAIPHLKRVLW